MGLGLSTKNEADRYLALGLLQLEVETRQGLDEHVDALIQVE